MSPAHKIYMWHACLIHVALWALLPTVSASKLCTTIEGAVKKCSSFVWALQQCASRCYEGLRNTRILSESLKNMHNDLWRSLKNASPVYERFNSVHHGFMGALEIRISNFWVVEKYAQRCVKVIKNAPPLYERFNNVHHGFVTALKNVQRLFMSLSKIRSTIYEIHKNMYFRCMSASTMSITVLWRP